MAAAREGPLDVEVEAQETRGGLNTQDTDSVAVEVNGRGSRANFLGNIGNVFGRRSRNSSRQSSGSRDVDTEEEPVQRAASHGNREGAPPALSDRDRQYYNFALSHPVGRILVGLHADTIGVAERAGHRETTHDLATICREFYDSMQLAENKEEEMLSRIEARMIKNELSYHLTHQDFKIPSYFAPTRVIKNYGQRSEIQRVFPERTKFSGGQNESIVEFLTQLNHA